MFKRKNNNLTSNNKGASMIVAIIIMGILIVFTFSLMLVAYTLYASQTKNIASMKCSESANTLSQAIEDELSDENAVRIMQKMVKQRKESADIFANAGRQELADAEMAQAEVIQRYLPKQMSEEELEAALNNIFGQLGVTGPQDMGKIMGTATKQLAGKAEGKAISAKVKEMLARL